MRVLSDDEMNRLSGGASACLTSIAVTASVGGLFGGVGALIGGVAAATGPHCLAWW